MTWGVACAAVGAGAAPLTPAWASTEPRRLSVQNLHTGESLSAVFWENGRYVADALAAVNKVLRDFRTGEVHMIDPALLDLLDQIRTRADAKEPFHIISGYRSPRTNARLHKASSGVAKKSLHMQGKAVDIRLPGLQLSQLHRIALDLKAGGVGFYPGSDFVHVDVGAVRSWWG